MKSFTERINEENHTPPLRNIKVTFDNGDVIITSMAGHITDEQIYDYYALGNKFNLGFNYDEKGEIEDTMHAVTDVEILR